MKHILALAFGVLFAATTAIATPNNLGDTMSAQDALNVLRGDTIQMAQVNCTPNNNGLQICSAGSIHTCSCIGTVCSWRTLGTRCR